MAVPQMPGWERWVVGVGCSFSSLIDGVGVVVVGGAVLVVVVVDLVDGVLLMVVEVEVEVVTVLGAEVLAEEALVE